jgi:peroxygenase
MMDLKDTNFDFVNYLYIIFGSFAGKTEWKVLYLLAKDKDGFLSKGTIKGVYDGSLFQKLEQEISSSQKKSSNE